jgi:hypothetical protein
MDSMTYSEKPSASGDRLEIIAQCEAVPLEDDGK